MWISTRARGLFSLMAGATSGGIAQQGFVRDLQISYNVAAEKYKFHTPHGTLIL
ncbi:hypothetical protein BDM02DRAFT_3110897 [Thelephora ganbajun]|uniref:Uncharacterized protein n=1 Tax=Thelephora ganbajun TaxID=370292 RepID=A0ACB6ZNL5_THEGA|nr:hypothetical protein BDM02DRAFT_3110897 [Thelephora ganbajun]